MTVKQQISAKDGNDFITIEVQRFFEVDDIMQMMDIDLGKPE